MDQFPPAAWHWLRLFKRAGIDIRDRPTMARFYVELVRVGRDPQVWADVAMRKTATAVDPAALIMSWVKRGLLDGDTLGPADATTTPSPLRDRIEDDPEWQRWKARRAVTTATGLP